MPNNNPNFNPAYSTIVNIFLVDVNKNSVLNISRLNAECQFERVEFVENITDVFPTGALIVRDITDIVSFIDSKKIVQIKFEYQNGSYSYFDITSTAYVNNAASKTEQVYVSIYFTNVFYKYSQTHSLNSDLLSIDSNWKVPQVYRTHELVNYIGTNVLTQALNGEKAPDSQIDATVNYTLYKTLNPKEYRIESPTDNPIQYLNYLASAACSTSDVAKQKSDSVKYPSNLTGSPRFMFWTDFDNKINFKYFPENIEEDKNASNSIINTNYLRFGVFDGDAVVVKLSDGNYYRKIYHLRTDPNDQYVSKNYHYIRKVPKVYDTPSTPRGLTYSANVLSYQFQDEGEKYNIQLISSKSLEGSTPGSDEILCENHWGFYNELEPVNDGRSLTHLGQDFGNQKSFASLSYMGNTGYFQYVDNPEMWKNMFDMTPVHPHYPDEITLGSDGIAGSATHLQEINSIRYKNFVSSLSGSPYTDRLELSRKIEKQNFIMYALCCMSKQQESFFAKLTRFEVDNTVTNIPGYTPYRYNWAKINFNSPYGATGPSITGASGSTYYMHQLEKWSLDDIWCGNTTQDDSWAINLNERTVGTTYLPPGWVPTPPTTGNFKWRPIGLGGSTFAPLTGTSGPINHIVRMYAVPATDILENKKGTPSSYFVGKYLYYFSAENVVDGTCS